MPQLPGSLTNWGKYEPLLYAYSSRKTIAYPLLADLFSGHVPWPNERIEQNSEYSELSRLLQRVTGYAAISVMNAN